MTKDTLVRFTVVLFLGKLIFNGVLGELARRPDAILNHQGLYT